MLPDCVLLVRSPAFLIVLGEIAAAFVAIAVSNRARQMRNGDVQYTTRQVTAGAQEVKSRPHQQRKFASTKQHQPPGGPCACAWPTPWAPGVAPNQPTRGPQVGLILPVLIWPQWTPEAPKAGSDTPPDSTFVLLQKHA